MWIKEVEMVDSLDELKSSRSVYGKDFPNFEMLDAKIACALNKIIQNSQFKKKGSVSTRKTDRLHDLQLLSRDWRSGYSIRFSVTPHDDNIQEFDTRWDEVLSSMSKIPSDEILECLYKLRIRESDQLKTVFELYDMEIHLKTLVSNHQKLKTMMKTSINQKLRLRNVDARHGRIESGAVTKSRKGLSGVDGGKGTCYQWKEKRPVFARRPLQFPARDPISCGETRMHCRHTF